MVNGLFKCVLEASMEGVAVLEGDRIVRHNDEYAATFGYESVDLVGTEWRRLYDEKEVERFETDVFPALERDGRWRGEATGERRDGRPVSHEVSLREEDDHVVWVVSDGGPSPDRRAERERYETIITNIRDAVYTLDATGRITWVNDVAVQEFDGGYDRDDLIGSSVSKVLPPEDIRQCSRIIGDLVESDRDSAMCEVTLLTTDGDEIPAELHLALLPSDDGGFQGTIGVARDVTRRKRQEQRLTVLNRILRHNVRTDMNVIAGHAGFLADVGEVGDHHRDHVAVIRETAEGLVELAEKARHLARIDDADDTAGPIDVAELLRTLCDRHEADHRDLEITRSLPGEAIVRAGPELETALDNLLENAIEHATDEDPRIDVSVSKSGGGDALEIEVADYGPGIPEEEVDVLRRGEEAPLEHASGLGLWLVTWIVTSYDGDVAFRERDRNGTAVTITLPAASAPESRIPQD